MHGSLQFFALGLLSLFSFFECCARLGTMKDTVLAPGIDFRSIFCHFWVPEGAHAFFAVICVWVAQLVFIF